jgi:hypothetical protein
MIDAIVYVATHTPSVAWYALGVITGMEIGRQVVRYALRNRLVGGVTAKGRKELS